MANVEYTPEQDKSDAEMFRFLMKSKVTIALDYLGDDEFRWTAGGKYWHPLRHVVQQMMDSKLYEDKVNENV